MFNTQVMSGGGSGAKRQSMTQMMSPYEKEVQRLRPEDKSNLLTKIAPPVSSMDNQKIIKEVSKHQRTNTQDYGV